MCKKLKEIHVLKPVPSLTPCFLHSIQALIICLFTHVCVDVCHTHSRTLFLLGLGYYMHDYILYLSISFYLFTQTHTQHKPTQPTQLAPVNSSFTCRLPFGLLLFCSTSHTKHRCHQVNSAPPTQFTAHIMQHITCRLVHMKRILEPTSSVKHLNQGTQIHGENGQN